MCSTSRCNALIIDDPRKNTGLKVLTMDFFNSWYMHD